MRDGFKPGIGKYLLYEDIGSPKTTVQALDMLPVTPSRTVLIGDVVNLQTGAVVTPASVADPDTGVLSGPKIVPLDSKSSK